ncbi:MAG: ABC transporter permease [Bacteroidales bacterium]|nr:ABC transporter permease [Candidatus Physcousia equi]
MSLAYFLARRLYRHGGDVKRVSRPAIRIATLGVSLGVAVMVVSVCVVMGFKQSIMQKLMGMGGHVQVLNYEYQVDLEQHPIVLDETIMEQLSALPGVQHVQRFINQAGMLKTDDAFQGVMLKGINEEYDTRFLAEHIVEGEMPVFSDSASRQQIMISQRLSRQLRLGLGSQVYAYFFDGKVRARKFTVAAIYATHMSEFDKTLVFTDMHTTRRLASYQPDQYSGAEINIANTDSLGIIALEVAQTVNHLTDDYGAHYTSPTIRDLYPGIFSWLTLLDTNVWVILCLMLAVAAFTMISGLLIIILERTQFIGTMKALGATNSRLRHLFLYFASFVILRGIFWGNVAGIGIVLLQYFTGFIHLDAATYYVDSVPVSLEWLFIIAINIGTLFISFLVLILPSYLVSRIHPAKSMRFE